MAKRIITVICPECGERLEVESDREITYCTECGAKVFLNDDADQTDGVFDLFQSIEKAYGRKNRMQEGEERTINKNGNDNSFLIWGISYSSS